MNNKPVLLGGQPVRSEPFAARKTMGPEEKKAVLKVMDSDVLSAYIGGPGKHFLGGEKVREFEKLWADKYGFKYAISVNSWTTGLMVAVGAVGIEPGDEVICSPYTMSASATCALFYGGIPVFADIDPVNFCLDSKSIEERITPRTKAIIVVHIFGGSADMDAIMEIAHKYNIKVIEDAAQAPGVFYKGKPIGAIGDIGGFSLNFHKHIHTGEGGMLVTNDKDIALKAQLIRNHGENYAEKLPVEDLPNMIGSNYRLTELQAAIGVEQLKKLPPLLKTRAELAAYLTEQFKDIDCLKTYPKSDNSDHAYYVYPILFNQSKAGISRKLFVKAINAEFPAPDGFENVPLTEGYVKPLYLNPVYQHQIAIGKKGFPFNQNPGVKYDYSKGICPVAERMYDEEMIISPIVREPLTKDDMQNLVVAIKKVLKYSDELNKAFPDSGDSEIYTPLAATSDTQVR